LLRKQQKPYPCVTWIMIDLEFKSMFILNTKICQHLTENSIVLYLDFTLSHIAQIAGLGVLPQNQTVLEFRQILAWIIVFSWTYLSHYFFFGWLYESLAFIHAQYSTGLDGQMTGGGLPVSTTSMVQKEEMINLL